jgi:hypothetical protein
MAVTKPKSVITRIALQQSRPGWQGWLRIGQQWRKAVRV